MYKKNDKVLIKSPAGDIMPVVEAVLVEQVTLGWICNLTKPDEIAMFKRVWGIPFKYPLNVETFVFEDDIVKKARRPKRRKRPRKPKQKTI